MSCTCFIVPREVLTRLSQDRELSAELRKGLFDTAQISHELRALRSQAAKLTSVAMAHAGALVELAASPQVTVYDCKHSQHLPGTPVHTLRRIRQRNARSAKRRTSPNSTRTSSTAIRSTIRE